MPALVTGGLHWQEDGVPPTTEPPYAVLRVKSPSDRIDTAAAVYVESFTLMVEVYTPTVRTGIMRALMNLDRSQAAWPVTGSGKCLLVKPGEYEEPPDGDRQHAAGEWVLRTAWAVQMQQTRG